MVVCAALVGAVFGVAEVWAESVSEAREVRASDQSVYRSVTTDGVVEFNDFGVGEVVELDVPPALSPREVARTKARQQDILNVAQVLASDRSKREAQRDAERDERRDDLARQERDRLAAIRAADAVYYPARSTLYSPFHSRRFSPNVGERRLRQSRPNAGRYVYAPETRRPAARRGQDVAPVAPREYRNIEPDFRRRP